MNDLSTDLESLKVGLNNFLTYIYIYIYAMKRLPFITIMWFQTLLASYYTAQHSSNWQ